jgi:hypothetical protein
MPKRQEKPDTNERATPTAEEALDELPKTPLRGEIRQARAKSAATWGALADEFLKMRARFFIPAAEKRRAFSDSWR